MPPTHSPTLTYLCLLFFPCFTGVLCVGLDSWVIWGFEMAVFVLHGNAILADTLCTKRGESQIHPQALQTQGNACY